MAIYSKLLGLLKTHKKQALKVGFFVTAHSLAFMGIPLLFKGS